MSKNKHKFDSELARRNLDGLFSDSFYQSSETNYIDRLEVNMEKKTIANNNESQEQLSFTYIIKKLDESISDIRENNSSLLHFESLIIGGPLAEYEQKGFKYDDDGLLKLLANRVESLKEEIDNLKLINIKLKKLLY